MYISTNKLKTDYPRDIKLYGSYILSPISIRSYKKIAKKRLNAQKIHEKKFLKY